MLNAKEIWTKKLAKVDINFSEISVDKRKDIFTEVKNLYVLSKHTAYKNLVNKIYAIYQDEDSLDTNIDNLNLLDVDFGSLVTKSNVQDIEKYLKEYLKELEDYTNYFNDIAIEFELNEEQDKTKYLLGDSVDANTGIFYFILYLVKTIFNLFKSDEDKDLNVFTADNKHAVCESLWQIVKLFAKHDSAANDTTMKESKKYMDVFFNIPYHELLGDALHGSLKEKSNFFVKDTIKHVKGSYRFSIFAPDTVNAIYLYFIKYPKELNKDTLPRVLEIIPSMISKFIENKYLELIRSAGNHVQYKIDKFIFDVNQGNYDVKQATDYCGDILDLIESTNSLIENTLYKTRFELVKTFLGLLGLNFVKVSDLFETVVECIDNIILAIDLSCRNNFQERHVEILRQEVDTDLKSSNIVSSNAIKSMLVTYKEFSDNNFLQKIKQQAQLIIAASPEKRLQLVGKNGDKYYFRRHSLDADLNYEMNQIVTVVSDEYSQKGGKLLEISEASYGSGCTIHFTCISIYKILLDMRENKTNREVLRLLAFKYNYDNDVSKEYFARKIIKWHDSLKSLKCEDSDLDSDTKKAYLAQGASEYTSLGVYEPNTESIWLLKEMHSYKKEFIANPYKYLLKSDALYLIKIGRAHV